MANGTFRELGFDESVAGPKGEEVLLPKGTYVQVQRSTRQCPSLPLSALAQPRGPAQAQARLLGRGACAC